jgi:hypothetical protein
MVCCPYCVKFRNNRLQYYRYVWRGQCLRCLHVHIVYEADSRHETAEWSMIFSSCLKTQKRVRSSNWEMGVVCSAKVTMIISSR